MGASLLAIAAGHSASMLNVMLPSRASSLPQGSPASIRLPAYPKATCFCSGFADSCGLQLEACCCPIHPRHPCREIPTPNLPSG
ncbi:hypothetical protein PSJE_16905 [Pseudomonas jessenii]|nr:hypothetical protein PSJE_16905 [Pseudomonas jessenii]